MRLGIGLGLFCASAAWGASPDQAREAAAKAVLVIQTSQKAWVAKQTCPSCHHSTLPVMALKAARENGIPFDESVVRASAVHTFRTYADLDRAVQYTHIIDPAMDDGARLAMAADAGVRPSVVTAVYARHVALHQMADGHWQGLDDRPPQSYSPFSSTRHATVQSFEPGGGHAGARRESPRVAGFASGDEHRGANLSVARSAVVRRR
jgi:UDP:flavonoid glycosyltransferase YjiC (YdhE family)